MSRRPVLAVVAIVVSSLAPFVADGTYTVEFTGARRVHVVGKATAGPSHWLSGAGPSFSIVLHFPKGTAPADASGEEFLVFATRSRARPSPGQYRLMDPGDTLSGKSLEVVLTGDDRTPWECVAGTLDLSTGKSNAQLLGTFSVKFARMRDAEDRVGPRDTLVVAGRFDVPQ